MVTSLEPRFKSLCLFASGTVAGRKPFHSRKLSYASNWGLLRNLFESYIATRQFLSQINWHLAQSTRILIENRKLGVIEGRLNEGTQQEILSVCQTLPPNFMRV